MKHHLIAILILGLLLRLGFLFFSHHLYYPDELFQYLEPAYRLVHGYGIITWEYREGVRSWVIPGFLAGIIWLVKQLGLTQPYQYDLAVRSVLSILSLSTIWSIYTLTQGLSQNPRIALAAAFAVSVWYEWVYVAGRPLSEVLASYLLLSGAALAVRVIARSEVIRTTWQSKDPSKKLPRLSLKPGLEMTPVLAGSLLGLGSFLRIQYFIFPLLFVLYLYKKNKYNVPVKTIIGFVLGFALGGWVDYLTWGQWFYSQSQNISLSFGAGISRVFGVQPWYWYFTQLLISSTGLYLLSMYSFKKYPVLGWMIGGLVMIHSIFSHKEYRFVVLLIPLLLMAVTLGYFRLSRFLLSSTHQFWTWVIGLSLVSGLGFIGWLPRESYVYAQPILSFDSRLALYQTVATRPEVCGIYDSTTDWLETGGAYYLGRKIPLYSRDTPPAKASYVNYILAESANMPPSGYEKAEQHGSTVLFKRHGGCTLDPAYSWDRYIPAVEAVLKSK